MSNHWTEFRIVESYDDLDSYIQLLKNPDLKEYRENFYSTFKIPKQNDFCYLVENTPETIIVHHAIKFINSELVTCTIYSDSDYAKFAPQEAGEKLLKFGWKVHLLLQSPEIIDKRDTLIYLLKTPFFDRHVTVFVDYFENRMEYPDPLSFLELYTGKFPL